MNNQYKKGYNDAIIDVIVYLAGFFSVITYIPEKVKQEILDGIKKTLYKNE